MNFLDIHSDRAVRAAVDAYLEGRLRPAVAGEVIFETRNRSYRVCDGVVDVQGSGSLGGAEIVGWLVESPERATVRAWWTPGARAVFLVRRLGKHIVVTSATVRLEVNGSPVPSSPPEHGMDDITVPSGSPARSSVIPSPPPMPRFDVAPSPSETKTNHYGTTAITPSTPPSKGPSVPAPPARTATPGPSRRRDG